MLDYFFCFLLLFLVLSFVVILVCLVDLVHGSGSFGRSSSSVLVSISVCVLVSTLVFPLVLFFPSVD